MLVVATLQPRDPMVRFIEVERDDPARDRDGIARHALRLTQVSIFPAHHSSRLKVRDGSREQADGRFGGPRASRPWTATARRGIALGSAVRWAHAPIRVPRERIYP
jgi:hypothetical protein